METTERTYSSVEVCRALGISYRQLCHAVYSGRVPGQPRIVGSGVPREWTDRDVEDLRRVVEARRLAQEILGTVPPPVPEPMARATESRLSVADLLSRTG